MSSRSPTPLVAVDSMVLVWGIRREGAADRKQRARWLFERLEEEQAQVVVPSIVAAEYLVGVDAGRRRAVLASLSARFLVVPFDVRCAATAAKLFEIGKRAKAGDHGSRICLKADTMILASAIAAGASEFFTEDKLCQRIAKLHGKITAKPLPEMGSNLWSGLAD